MRLNVLACDDNAVDRLLCRRAFEEFAAAGVALDQVEDGPSLIERMTGRAMAVDLVLLDVEMPDLDGRATATYLADHGVFVPVLFLTDAPLDTLAAELALPNVVGAESKPDGVGAWHDLLDRLPLIAGGRASV